MRIIGCDLHARQQTLAMLDTATGEVVHKTLPHEGESVREFYSTLPGPVRVGIEATGSMKWFLQLMEELGIDCQVGHPATIRAAEPRRQKHDQRDAELLLKLLVENRFPSIWQPSQELLDLRGLLLHRHQWVRLRTRIQNALQAIAAGGQSFHITGTDAVDFLGACLRQAGPILRALGSCEGSGLRFQQVLACPSALKPNTKLFARHQNIAILKPLKMNSRPVGTSTVPFLFTRTTGLFLRNCYLGPGEENYETFRKISRPTLRAHHPAKSHLGSPHPRRTYPGRATSPRTSTRHRRTPLRSQARRATNPATRHRCRYWERQSPASHNRTHASIANGTPTRTRTANAGTTRTRSAIRAATRTATDSVNRVRHSSRRQRPSRTSHGAPG